MKTKSEIGKDAKKNTHKKKKKKREEKQQKKSHLLKIKRKEIRAPIRYNDNDYNNHQNALDNK